jgi:hypothetical protein
VKVTVRALPIPCKTTAWTLLTPCSRSCNGGIKWRARMVEQEVTRTLLAFYQHFTSVSMTLS